MGTTPTPSAAAGGTTKATKNPSKKPTKAGATKTKTVRKPKKNVTTSKGASASQQAYAAARAAQMDLAALRNEAAARKLDPLWYKPEDILPSVADDTLMSESAKILPEQVQIVEAALENNNLTRADVTPQAFACLLEQARRYAMEILTDSQDYAFVAGRSEIAQADLRLANEFRPDHPMAITTQLPKLNLLAQTINRIPLPPIPTQCYSGILLPPKHLQLTARTFDVVTSAQTARRMVQAAPPPPHKIKSMKKKAKDDRHKPSYGATRGRQIPVTLKSHAKKDDVRKEVENAEESKDKRVPEEESKKDGSATTTTLATTTTKFTSPTAVAKEEAVPVRKEDEDLNMEDAVQQEAAERGTALTMAAVAPQVPAAIMTEYNRTTGGSMDTSPS